MKIHGGFPEYSQADQMVESDAGFGAVNMRGQGIWVVIAVSIVVVLNGILSWV